MCIILEEMWGSKHAASTVDASNENDTEMVSQILNQETKENEEEGDVDAD